MDQDHLQAMAYRDQAWAGMRTLLPEIEKLAQGQLDYSERERHLIRVLAGVVAAELRIRQAEAGA